jgi:fatty acid desaturase
MRPSVDPTLLRDCARISPWRSLALCLAIHAAVVLLAWAGGRGSGYRLALPAIVVIAGLQHHLLILQHEGAHLLLHPRRRVNDLIADVFTTIPFLTLVKNYRVFHLTHHKYVGSPERDPEIRFLGHQGYRYARRRGLSLLAMLAKDLVGLHYAIYLRDNVRFLREQIRAGRLEAATARDLALAVLVWGGVLAPAVVFGFWREVLVFWALPAPTVLFFILKLHAYGEHTGATGPTEFQRTWVHVFHPLVDFFIYPINSGFHLEHHLFPKVPWYHMRRFRRALLESPEYAALAAKVTVTGYAFGDRTILGAMLLGEGEYRLDALAAETREIAGEVVSDDTREEVDAQLATAAPRPPG